MLRATTTTPLCGYSCIIFSQYCGGCNVGKQMLTCISSKSESYSSFLGEFASSHPNVARVVLKRGKTQLFRGGNPMVYSGAVDRIVGRPPPKSGDAVLVTDGALHPIAWGIYNSVSMFCVRIMQMEDETSRETACVLNMEKLLALRISAALDLRMRLGLPTRNTDVFRLVNSEGDRLSGLIVDIFGEYAVVASSAAWVEKYRSKIELALKHLIEPKCVFWKSSLDILKEEGLQAEDLDDKITSFESVELGECMQVVENGILYQVSLEGQKTGFYADQRDNRLLLRSLVKDKTVLDLCCYSGGFALNAAVGGAAHVTGVDSSLAALKNANINIQLNKLDPNSMNFVRADATEFMKAAISEGKMWDVVILDPPKLAPSRKVLQRATGMYRNLNSLAMQLTKPGGFLMTCSCSGAMTQSGSFMSMLQASASSANRRITQLRYAGAASDHTIDPSYPEGAYLTNVLLRIL